MIYDSESTKAKKMLNLKDCYRNWGKPRAKEIYNILIKVRGKTPVTIGNKSNEEKGKIGCSFNIYFLEKADLNEIEEVVFTILNNDDRIRRKGIIDYSNLPKVNDKRMCYITKLPYRKQDSKILIKFNSLQSPARIVEILKSYLNKKPILDYKEGEDEN